MTNYITGENMTFQDLVMMCFDEKELVSQFNRIFDCKIGETNNLTPVEILIDEAVNYTRPDDEYTKFINFVRNAIWLPLVLKKEENET